jgi:histone deacetylase complex regulatory component SIN3
MEAEEVVDRVKVLISGHPELIHAFNQFLPWRYIRSHGSLGGSSNN